MVDKYIPPIPWKIKIPMENFKWNLYIANRYPYDEYGKIKGSKLDDGWPESLEE